MIDVVPEAGKASTLTSLLQECVLSAQKFYCITV